MRAFKSIWKNGGVLKMTWSELVKEYFPNASDQEVDYILYNKTAFPLVGEEAVRKQLKELKDEVKL